MKNNDIINNLMDDNIIDDIQADINAELEKSEPDYDKIAELTALMTEIMETDLSDEKITRNISKITEEYDSHKKRDKIKILYRWISALSACIVLVLALNAYTMVSFGDNLFKAVVEMTQSGFSIDFSQDEPTIPTETESTTTMTNMTTIAMYTTVTTTDNEPIPTLPSVMTTMAMPSTTGAAIQIPVTTEQMIQTTVAPTVTTTDTEWIGSGNNNMGDIISEKCSEIGIVPCVPDYYTDMELKDFSHEENETSTDCYFTFEDDDRQLDIIIEQYNNTEDIPTVLIPSNQIYYDVFVNDNIGKIFMFAEDTHITAVFVYKNAVYTTTGYNFTYSDMEAIILAYCPDRQN